MALIWLGTSHSAVQSLAGNPTVTQQLGCCECLPYRLGYEVLESHAIRGQGLLHSVKTTQHSTQQADVRCFCILGILQKTFRNVKMDLWRLVCPVTRLQVKQKDPLAEADLMDDD